MSFAKSHLRYDSNIVLVPLNYYNCVSKIPDFVFSSMLFLLPFLLQYYQLFSSFSCSLIILLLLLLLIFSIPYQVPSLSLTPSNCHNFSSNSSWFTFPSFPTFVLCSPSSFLFLLPFLTTLRTCLYAQETLLCCIGEETSNRLQGKHFNPYTYPSGTLNMFLFGHSATIFFTGTLLVEKLEREK